MATKAMVRVMKEAFKDRLALHKTVKLVLILCDDLQSSAPLVFSYVDALESKSFNFQLWEVCRATWAKLGQFEPGKIRSVDRSMTCVRVTMG
ncbi:hypothetical protein B296_00052987 [Ensete ventricosum]|uniref:Uncharacterized protein n=1 Tax=Ensete ventricosum TaxID=4639 RepID=A0A426YA17_ENSVE|nr:hypothetical protein B296_00052987 [Ensete ventricosum]